MARPANNPHDSLFRALLDDSGRASVVVREFLPPAIAALLAPDPPRLIDGSFIDETLADSQSDRLFEVALTSGTTAFVYVLMEHKSSLDARTPLQLLSYMVRIWDRHAQGKADRLRALPPILPIVVYHGKARWHGEACWTVADTLLDCVDTGGNRALTDYVRALRYEVHDLGRRDDDRMSAADDVEAVWLALKYVSRTTAPPEVIVRILARLTDGTLLAQQIVRYILDRQHWINVDDWKQLASEAKPGMEEDMVSLAAQEWLNQGRAEGKAEGREEGEAIGACKALLDFLESRFGPIDPAVRKRVADMPAEQLRPMLRRAASAPTIDAVLDSGSSH